MNFIGQHAIMIRLDSLLRDLFENPEMGVNILLRGPSGYGKTTMALKICQYLAGRSFEIYWAEFTKWRFQKRVIFIDEIHRVQDHEKLFKVMDSKEHVMVFATNQDSLLPEAFVNRCREYIFDEYSIDELLLIARDASEFLTSDESFYEIIEAGNRNPRIIKGLCAELNSYFRVNSEISSLTTDFRMLLRRIFSIEDGLDNLCRSYLVALRDSGGSASIGLLKSLLHVDEGTLKNRIEPILVRKRLIKITSRGRSLTENADI